MNSNKNNLPLTIDGNPNLDNPSVLAGLLDCAGMNLTMTLNDIGARANAATNPDDSITISAQEAYTLIGVQKLLRLMRDSVAVQHELSSSQVDICDAVMREVDAHNAKMHASLDATEDRIREMAKALGLENEFDQFLAAKRNQYGVAPRKTSVADAADAILNDLRESGTIGGTRAV